MDKILHFCNIRDWNTGLQVLFVVMCVCVCLCVAGIEQSTSREVYFTPQ